MACSEPRLIELAAKYQPQGVAILGINANQQDSITEVAAHAQKHKIPFHVLKDPGNKVADQFGAIRTPEMFVLDQDRVIRYWGRIDDKLGIGYIRDKSEKDAAGRPNKRSKKCIFERIRRIRKASV